MPEAVVDFRAPPPSPVASGRRSSVTNDEVLTEFLESSLRVPDLVLPDKFFPKQKLLETPPKVDFVSLCFHRDEAECDAVLDAMAKIGCFQLMNHGIPRELVVSAAEAAAGVFGVPPVKREALMRSPEKPWGYEEYHGGEEEEEEEGSEMCEEFVWCREDELKLNMEGISPIGYPNFSKKMEKLMLRIETVAEKILPVILEKIPRKIEVDDMDLVHHGHDVGTVCCIYKHCRDNREDQWPNSLKYDVIRMLIRGTDYSHSLGFHVCDGSTEFHVYSKKSWLSFCPEEGAIIITGGDETQRMSDGHYKHVIGRPIFRGKNEDSISMAFLYHPTNAKNDIQTNSGRTISLAQQAILAIILTLMYHVLISVTKFLN
ncbi:1-aminocyclopropane-1-carboxylate oxidase 1 [Arachis duranensis]|uniref:1-aminocyclopropane-1-carboxylate oxidase 1 n=1 Tax=Arachis duranensis TaxID=130453 RepID=A0A6P4C420_ARADU|nr:1-aminocyclopropane-1-carboxylate oxidase 1 [Arachis duranensis]